MPRIRITGYFPTDCPCQRVLELACLWGEEEEDDKTRRNDEGKRTGGGRWSRQLTLLTLTASNCLPSAGDYRAHTLWRGLTLHWILKDTTASSLVWCIASSSSLSCLFKRPKSASVGLLGWGQCEWRQQQRCLSDSWVDLWPRSSPCCCTSRAHSRRGECPLGPNGKPPHAHNEHPSDEHSRVPVTRDGIPSPLHYARCAQGNLWRWSRSIDWPRLRLVARFLRGIDALYTRCCHTLFLPSTHTFPYPSSPCYPSISSAVILQFNARPQAIATKLCWDGYPNTTLAFGVVD